MKIHLLLTVLTISLIKANCVFEHDDSDPDFSKKIDELYPGCVVLEYCDSSSLVSFDKAVVYVDCGQACDGVSFFAVYENTKESSVVKFDKIMNCGGACLIQSEDKQICTYPSDEPCVCPRDQCTCSASVDIILSSETSNEEGFCDTCHGPPCSYIDKGDMLSCTLEYKPEYKCDALFDCEVDGNQCAEIGLSDFEMCVECIKTECGDDINNDECHSKCAEKSNSLSETTTLSGSCSTCHGPPCTFVSEEEGDLVCTEEWKAEYVCDKLFECRINPVDDIVGECVEIGNNSYQKCVECVRKECGNDETACHNRCVNSIDHIVDGKGSAMQLGLISFTAVSLFL
eukprot:TRINITY_DN8365_c0_g1_i1.p1 TRINITY_DN8365_c0_g1~~TRINITY_DN8365_c0_g1_i1.p1  ORF type:complete len:343 (-),score=69.22 TRINITY_DN8365_c0_g1_i1:41-1069(-)